MKQKAVGQEDNELWERITDVPYVSRPISILCAFLNLLFPGLGTLTAACNTKYDSVSKAQMTAAFLQLLTALFIVGWILAFYWSVLIIRKSFKEDQTNKSNVKSRVSRVGNEEVESDDDNSRKSDVTKESAVEEQWRKKNTGEQQSYVSQYDL